ncbi:MAG: hypothetical protein K1X79_01600 [Oligoflexia bacterium]|nr:hypothetical protein [Oligoflexia bacterium]
MKYLITRLIALSTALAISTQLAWAQTFPLDELHLTAAAVTVIVQLDQQGTPVIEIIRLMHEAREQLCDPDIPGPKELYRNILLRLALQLREIENDSNNPTDLSPEERLAIWQYAFSTQEDDHNCLNW